MIDLTCLRTRLRRFEVQRSRVVRPLLHVFPPFTKPKTGRIAVKVINHFGDDVLEVYPIK